MNLCRSVRNLTKFERGLWLTSMTAVLAASALGGGRDWLTLLTPIIGVSALIFVAKGDVLGQLLTVFFSLSYALISFQCQYYGEMITYLGITTPIAIASVVAWLKNPYSEQEVKVNAIGKSVWLILLLSTAVVTICFFFILRFFDTSYIGFGTLSVATSFFASSLMLLRSPYYALAYAANDVVLIILWLLASRSDLAYTPMLVCFAIFLVNDIYGYRNWKLMRYRQQEIYLCD